MSENITTAQYFEMMLQEQLGHSYIEKQGGVWPPAGKYEITFEAVDESTHPDTGLPMCLINSHGGLKVPYIINKAALPSIRGQRFDYVFWFSTEIGAQIAMDQLVHISGSERVPFNARMDAGPLFSVAQQINGVTWFMVREVVTTKKGKRVGKDRFVHLDQPTTKQVSAPAEPSVDALADIGDGIPF